MEQQEILAKCIRVSATLPEIRTERLILKKLSEENASDMFGCLSDPDVVKYLPFAAHKTPKQTAIYVKHLIKGYAEGRYFDWAVVLPDGNMIGTCGFSVYDPVENRVEMGYVLHPAYQKKGYATEAAKAVMAYAFDVLGVDRVSALCLKGNEASERVMERCGLSFEEEHPNSLFLKGEYRTVRIYSRTR